MAEEIRTRRNRSFWEPIYNPNDKKDFPEAKLDQNRPGFTHSTINLESFSGKRRLDGQVFAECNFAGLFTNNVFNKCSFTLCDFGLTTWKYAKFSRCQFSRSSFTQATFISCEFRDCSWHEMGLAGNETRFISTTLDNPHDFVHSAFTTLDRSIVEPLGGQVFYQFVRLQRTKANVARHILNVLMTEGEEEWYYQAICVYSLQSFLASYYETRWLAVNTKSWYKRLALEIRATGYILERTFIQALAFFNNWGASLLRPLAVGFAIAALFSCIYRYFEFAKSWKDAWLTSIDITLVAGYTKHAIAGHLFSEQSIYLSNLIFGLFWFSIVVPTLINRISRVR